MLTNGFIAIGEHCFFYPHTLHFIWPLFYGCVHYPVFQACILNAKQMIL